jgi:hypothetical protein
MLEWATYSHALRHERKVAGVRYGVTVSRARMPAASWPGSEQ